MHARIFRAPDWAVAVILLAWTSLAATAACLSSFAKIAWPDECIYLVGARNLIERGTLNTSFYLTHSILIRGYPHRDVHMPGYVLALAPVVRAFGATLTAALVLNVATLMGSVVLLYVIGRRVTGSRKTALAAAALLPLLPPYPGYLTVVYPELVVTCALLAGLAWLLRGGGTPHAAVAGAVFAASGAFRETLWIALPIYALVLPWRRFWRAFVPAALVTLLLVVVPLSRNRAVHPNAIYPSVLVEAQRSANPVATFVGVLERNLDTNVRMAAAASPVTSAEDAVLLFLASLALTSLLAWRALGHEGRRFAVAVWLSLGLLTAAVFVLYVVRERGGVWGGVRAYMTWAPLLLLLVVARIMAARRWVQASAFVLGVVLFVAMGRWQIYAVMRDKYAALEDGHRNALYLARHIDGARPHRIVSRSFLYGYTHYPVEVVWGVPWNGEELAGLEKAIPYEFISIHEKHPLRLHLIQNPRYVRVNKDDRGAEFLIWRRLY